MITHPPVLGGSTDYSCVIRIIDSTDGTPETAVEHNTSGIDLEYRRGGQGAVVDITEAALAAPDSTHSDGGIEHIGAGYYRLDLPDAAVAAGVPFVTVGGTITGMVVIGAMVPIVAYNPADGVRLGLTALPNAAADAAGGLPISDAGGLDLDAQLVTKINDILTDTGTTLQGEVDGIQADTEDIQNRLPAALVSGRIDASVGAMAANVVTAAAVANGAIDAATFAADVDAEILSYLVDDATRIDASALNTASVTTIPAIVADTNELQTDWANGGRLDLLIDSILGDTNELQTDWADGGRLEVFIDGIEALLSDGTVGLAALETLVDDLENRITAALSTQLIAHSLGVGRGVVDAGSDATHTIIKTMNGGAASAQDDLFNGRHLVATSGALFLAATSISDYDGTTKTLTHAALPAGLAEDVTFVVV